MSYILLDNNGLWSRIKRAANENNVNLNGKTGVTVVDLAREIVLYFQSKNDTCISAIKMKEMSKTAASFHMMDVSVNLCRAGKLEYFTETMLNDVETAKELDRLISILRLGQDRKNWKSCVLNQVSGEQKRVEDVLLICEEYCKNIEEEGIFDEPRFICEAVCLMKDENNKNEYLGLFGEIYSLCLNKDILSFKEKELRTLLEAKEIDLSSCLSGMDSLSQGEESSKRKADSKVFRFYKAYGIDNEIRYIIEQLKKNDWSFGDIDIYYPTDKYESYIMSVLGREGIPYAFVTGKAISSGYIHLMKSIILWAMNGFMYSDFKKIITSELLKDRCFGVRRWNDQTIGWGRQRYVDFSNKKIDYLKVKKEEFLADNEYKKLGVEEKKKAEGKYDRQIAYYKMVKGLAEIFEFADNDKKSDVSIIQLFNALIDLMDHNTRRKRNPERVKSLRVLRDCRQEVTSLSVMSQRIDGNEPEKKLNRLYEYVSSLMKAYPERPDAISVAKYGNTVFSDRKVHFLVGMSMAELKADEDESPVLTDRELEQLLEDNTFLARNRGEQLKSSIENTLQNAFGEIYMSYCYYDTSTMLESSANNLYIEYLDKEYHGAEPEKIGFEVIDKCYDFSLKNEAEKYSKIDDVEIEKAYEDESEEDEYSDEEYEDGDELEYYDDNEEEEKEDYEDEMIEIDYYDDYEDEDNEEDDDKEEMEDYDDDDGWVDEDDPEYEKIVANDSSAQNPQSQIPTKNLSSKDERHKNNSVVKLSPTRIETLLNCPRQFSYRYIDYIPEDEDYMVREDQWLPAYAKGNFVHDVMKDYVQKCFMDNPCRDMNETVFDSIFDDISKSYKADYPIMNEKTAEDELDHIKKMLIAYLKNMHDSFKNDGWKVFAVEDTYYSDDLLEIVNKEKLIPETSAKEYLVFDFEGRIDRIDYRENNGAKEYRIVDYKSGSLKNLEEKKKGLLLAQYDLYCRLLEEVIPEAKGAPISFEYHLILEGSDAETYPIVNGGKDKDLFEKIKKCIVDFFYSDNTIPLEMDEKKRCKYCKYTSICNMSRALRGGK